MHFEAKRSHIQQVRWLSEINVEVTLVGYNSKYYVTPLQPVLETQRADEIRRGRFAILAGQYMILAEPHEEAEGKFSPLFMSNYLRITSVEEITITRHGGKRVQHANGGILLRDLRMPDFHVHAVHVPSPGAVSGQDTMVLGNFLRDVSRLNEDQHNFRVFGPDETLSNLLGAVFEVTNRQWDARKVKNDEFLAPAGRVLDSMLSENQCEGWLEGYLLTGRHGLFNSYEAFIRSQWANIHLVGWRGGWDEEHQIAFEDLHT